MTAGIPKETLIDWLTVFLTPGVGPAACRTLADYFEKPERILQASDKELKQAGINQAARTGLTNKPARGEAEKEILKIEQKGADILLWTDSRYPFLLRNIHNPPFLLYCLGNPDFLIKPCVGIVGSRAATDYGRNIARAFASQLAKKDITVISGMAHGIDAAAHDGALSVKGPTAAVLGCGLDIIYPRANGRLYDRIAESGVLVSEYPLGTSPDSFRFPARNRIISGLSLGVLVVEATRKSGSLITAQLALEQGREVFAVPGRIDSFKSEGTHALLKEGAKLVHSIEDILEEVNLSSGIEKKYSPEETVQTEQVCFSQEERQLIDFLDVYPKGIDEIIRGVDLPAQKVNQLLLLLELKNRVEVLPGNQYKLLFIGKTEKSESISIINTTN